MSLRSVAHQLLDSPYDGNLYGRENGAWVTVPSSSGGMAEAPTDGQLYGRRGSTASWLPVMAVASGVPASPAANQLWWNLTDGNMYLWFNDGTSTQWVPAVATAAAAGGPYLGLGGGTMTGAIVLPDGSNALSQTVGDARYLRQTGGTVTGATTFSGPTTLTAPLIWTATGSSTPRAAQDRSAELIDVKDYGAKGDGTTNDTAAVAAAFAAAAAGGEIWFPPGNYVLASAISQSFTGSVTVCGSGPGVSVLSCAANGIAISMATGQNAAVRDLSIVTTAAGLANTGLSITAPDQSAQVWLENLRLRGASDGSTGWQTSINIVGCGVPRIRGITVLTVNGPGTGLSGATCIAIAGVSSALNSDNYEISDCQLQGGLYGLYIGNYVEGVLLTNVVILGNDYAVYASGNGNMLEFTNCHMNPGVCGVYANSWGFISIVSTFFLRFRTTGNWTGIDLESDAQVAICACNFYGNNNGTEIGILVNNAWGPVTITGNTFLRLGTAAVRLSGTTATAMVVGNNAGSMHAGSVLVNDTTGNASNQAVANSFNSVPDIDVSNNNLVVSGNGAQYLGLSGGAHVIGFTWDGNIEGYVDGNHTTTVADTNWVNSNFLKLSAGGTVTGPLTIGTGTGTPTLTLNGAAGTNKGIYWQSAGTNRWRLQTDASENLGLYAYDASGAYIDYGVLFNPVNRTATFDFGIATNITRAFAAGAAGNTFAAVNTGANAAIGHTFTYQSTAGGSGFDTDVSIVSIFDTTFVSGVSPALEAMWVVSQSPNDATHAFGCNVAELNIVNRGPDSGWMRDRTTPNPTGGLLMVAEVATFGGSGGGEGKNATYAYSVSHSGANNSTGFPGKFYNCFLAEPNSAVGGTGRAIYVTGDITGTVSQYPYGPLQTDGAWFHGIDHTKATYADGHAQTMLVGQGTAWINGTTTSPTSTASINTFGTGADVSISLMPGGNGGVYMGNGSNTQSLTLNGASGVNSGINWETGGNTRWRLILDASNNLQLYSYSSTGGFLGTTASFGSAGGLAFNGNAPLAKPTVTGAKGGNAALGSLLTALASYGLITDSTTA